MNFCKNKHEPSEAKLQFILFGELETDHSMLALHINRDTLSSEAVPIKMRLMTLKKKQKKL